MFLWAITNLTDIPINDSAFGQNSPFLGCFGHILIGFRNCSRHMDREIVGDSTKLWQMAMQRQPTCEWCGTEVIPSGRGRPRKFCSHSCRQRAYEQRNAVAGTNIPATAVIIQPERVNRLQDSLFELRCAAEDIQTANAEGADPEEISQLCNELVTLARHIEKLRIR